MLAILADAAGLGHVILVAQRSFGNLSCGLGRSHEELRIGLRVVLDHVIVSATDTYSMKAHGLL